MRKSIRHKILLFFVLSFVVAPLGFSQTSEEAETATPQDFFQTKDTYMVGRVEKVLKEGIEKYAGEEVRYQDLRIDITRGKEKGKTVDVTFGGSYQIREEELYDVGNSLVIVKTETADGSDYAIADRYRLPALAWIGVIFFVLAVGVGRWKGLTSFLGLLVSIGILGKYIVPQILDGRDPLLISVSGAIAIAVISLYLAHGFSRRTSVALVSTLIALVLSAGLSVAFVKMAHLLGLGSEEAFLLQTGLVDINLQGLLLGGILIGSLGVLDDITTAQTAAVDEIYQADPTMDFQDLFRRGISVGREHIASLVNTLVLAYAGTSLPLFLLFVLNAQPWWVLLNSELIAEEIVRTLVGSATLICAVPIATLLASIFLREHSSKRV